MLRWGVTLGIAFFGGAALIGYPDLIGQAPVFSTMALAIILSLSMAAWMRFRHRGWRPSLEMGGATMGLGIGLVALGTLIPASDLFEWVTRLACPVMLVPMLFRLDPLRGAWATTRTPPEPGLRELATRHATRASRRDERAHRSSRARRARASVPPASALAHA